LYSAISSFVTTGSGGTGTFIWSAIKRTSRGETQLLPRSMLWKGRNRIPGRQVVTATGVARRHRYRRQQ